MAKKATKSTTNSKKAKGMKMATKSTTKARTSSAKKEAADEGAEAMKVLDGPEPEARTGEVDALEPASAGEEVQTMTETEQAWEISKRVVALVETAGAEDAVEILRSLGFEQTGKALEEVRYPDLVGAAKAWRDATTDSERRDAEGIAARAGWFRPPQSTPSGAAAPPTAPDGSDGSPGGSAAGAAPDAPASVTNPDLGALQADVEEAKAALAAAETEAKKLEEEARTRIAKAKERYRAALAPYRDACKVQGRVCEFEGGARGANVSERVGFDVEIVGENVRIAIKGRPETEERVPLEQARTSANRIATAFTERWLGPKSMVGNKSGSLSNKLRAVFAGASAAPATT